MLNKSLKIIIGSVVLGVFIIVSIIFMFLFKSDSTIENKELYNQQIQEGLDILFSGNDDALSNLEHEVHFKILSTNKNEVVINVYSKNVLKELEKVAKKQSPHIISSTEFETMLTQLITDAKPMVTRIELKLTNEQAPHVIFNDQFINAVYGNLYTAYYNELEDLMNE